MAKPNVHFVKLLTVACLLLVATPLSSECGERLQTDNRFPTVNIGYEKTNFDLVLSTACFTAGDTERGFSLANRDTYIIAQIEPKLEVPPDPPVEVPPDPPVEVPPDPPVEVPPDPPDSPQTDPKGGHG